MASRTVTSPAGETIEIVPDEEWKELTGAFDQGMRQWNAGSKRWLIRELWEHGAVPHNSNGQATGVFWERLNEHYPQAASDLPDSPHNISTLFGQPMNAPAIERKIHGKRTYSIKLVALPEMWHRKLLDDIGEPVFTATPVDSRNGTEPSVSEPDIPSPSEGDREAALLMESVIFPPVIDEEPSPAIDIDISSQVAMELLTRVVEIIHAGSVDQSPELRRLRNELAHSQSLLAARLDENERYRKQLRDIGEELKAVRFERDGLRGRLRQTEANLGAALKGESAHAVTTEVMKRVDRIMREPPKSNRGDE